MKVCKVEWCDENEIIEYKDEGYAEIILYDINYNEKARTMIDLDDVERCKPFKWSLRNDGYVSTKINGKEVKLHRFILNTPKGKHTDHININRLDNRKSNLRICTQQQNNKNKSMYENNKIGKRGVIKREKTYDVYLRYGGECCYFGGFKDFDNAVKAREETEIKFYGHILD